MEAALEGVTKMIEKKVDEEIERADAELKALETMDDDELEMLREKRREALKKAQDQKQVQLDTVCIVTVVVSVMLGNSILCTCFSPRKGKSVIQVYFS